MRGIVVRYDTAKGWGFLRGDFSRRGNTTRFHKSAVVGGVVPRIDAVVEYVEQIGKDGRLRAVNVKVV